VGAKTKSFLLFIIFAIFALFWFYLAFIFVCGDWWWVGKARESEKAEVSFAAEHQRAVA
jgi:hypothetical protein